MLYQPTFVTPSELVYGEGYISSTETFNFSWKVNGNSPMLRWKIRTYYYNTSTNNYVQITDSTALSYGCPFYGQTVPSNDADYEVQLFSVDRDTAGFPSTTTIPTPNDGKIYFRIYQWYASGTSDYVTSPLFSFKYGASYEISEVSPASTITSKDHTFEYILYQTTTSNTKDFDCFRFMLSDSPNYGYGNIYDTGYIYGTQRASVTFDGFVNGETYYYTMLIQKDGETYGSTDLDDWTEVEVEYDTLTDEFEISVCKVSNASSGVKVTWGDLSDFGADVHVPTERIYTTLFPAESEYRIPQDLHDAVGFEIKNTSSTANYLEWYNVTEKISQSSGYYTEFGFLIQMEENCILAQIDIGNVTYEINGNQFIVHQGTTTVLEQEIYYVAGKSRAIKVFERPDHTIDITVISEGGTGGLDYRYDYQRGCSTTMTSHSINTAFDTVSVRGTDVILGFLCVAQHSSYTSDSDSSFQFLASGFESGGFFWTYDYEFCKEVQDEYVTKSKNKPGEFVITYIGGTSLRFNDYESSAPTNITMYRKSTSDIVMEKVSEPISISETSAIDYSAKSLEEYTYYVLLTSPDKIYPLSEPSSAFSFQMPNWYLLEAEKRETGVYELVREFIFANNVSSGSIGNNNAPVISDTFTGYPVIQKSVMNYKSGTLESLIGSVELTTINGEYETVTIGDKTYENYTYGQRSTLKYSDTIETRDAIMALATTDNALFLKNRKGDLFRVRIAGAITATTDDNTVEQTQTISIPWAEVGSAEGIGIFAHTSDI